MAKAKTEAPAPDTVDETLATAGTDPVAAPAETLAPPPAAEPQLVRARVLCGCDLGAPNDVIDVPAQLAQDRADVLDADPAAVAYALAQAV